MQTEGDRELSVARRSICMTVPESICENEASQKRHVCIFSQGDERGPCFTGSQGLSELFNATAAYMGHDKLLKDDRQ